jgi:hypothetical protein
MFAKGKAAAFVVAGGALLTGCVQPGTAYQPVSRYNASAVAMRAYLEQEAARQYQYEPDPAPLPRKRVAVHPVRPPRPDDRPDKQIALLQNFASAHAAFFAALLSAVSPSSSTCELVMMCEP